MRWINTSQRLELEMANRCGLVAGVDRYPGMRGLYPTSLTDTGMGVLLSREGVRIF